jgi:hypothetical protein
MAVCGHLIKVVFINPSNSHTPMNEGDHVWCVLRVGEDCRRGGQCLKVERSEGTTNMQERIEWRSCVTRASLLVAINDGRLGSVYKFDDGYIVPVVQKNIHRLCHWYMIFPRVSRWFQVVRWYATRQVEGAWATASSAVEQRRRDHMAEKECISLWIRYKGTWNFASGERRWILPWLP